MSFRRQPTGELLALERLRRAMASGVASRSTTACPAASPGPPASAASSPRHSVDRRLRIGMDVLHGGAVSRRAYRTPGRKKKLVDVRSKFVNIFSGHVGRKIVDQPPDNRPRSENRGEGDIPPPP